MAWATPSQLRFYIRNLEPIDDSVLQSAIDAAVSYIRARLVRLYPELHDESATPPAPLPTVALQLAAALVEARTLAITNVGATANPYAQQLYQQAMEELTRLERGLSYVPGADLSTLLPVFQAGTPVPVREIGQIRKTGSGW